MSVYSSVTSRLRGWEAPRRARETGKRQRKRGRHLLPYPAWGRTSPEGHQSHLDCVDSTNVCPASTVRQGQSGLRRGDQTGPQTLEEFTGWGGCREGDRNQIHTGSQETRCNSQAAVSVHKDCQMSGTVHGARWRKEG